MLFPVEDYDFGENDRFDDNEEEDEEEDSQENGGGEEVDSEATITDDEEEIVCSDDEGELEDNNWINATGNSCESNLNPFESDFARLWVEEQLTEKLGDKIIALVSKYSNIQSRKTKAIINNLKGNSLRSFNYAMCDKCNSVVRKQGNLYRCGPCNEVLSTNELNNYVSFNLEDQLNVLSNVSFQEQPLVYDDPLTIDLIITCDAVPLSKSSDVHLYPVIIYIDNIKDLNLRSKCFILGSVAMIRKKKEAVGLNVNLLLQTLLQDFNRINSSNGIVTNWSRHTKIRVVSFLADTPCRAQFLNVQQHNGTYPCHRCHIKIEHKKVPILQHHRLVPKTFDLVQSYIHQLESRSHQRENHVFGVKGKCILSRFNFDYIKSSPLEIMHCLFLGFVKTFLSVYIFSSKNSFDSSKKNLVNERIAMIKPPSTSKRSIRKLADFKHFKSSEFEMIFFIMAISFLKEFYQMKNSIL